MAAAGVAAADRSLAAAQAQCATVASLARSMQPDPGSALGIDLAARMRFGERMDAAHSALIGMSGAARQRADHARAILRDADRRREIAEQLDARARRVAERRASRNALETLAGTPRTGAATRP